MSTFIGGVECFELVDGLEEGVHEQGPVATKKWLCDWTGRYAVANAMLGLVSGTGGPHPSIARTNPKQYPESPNMWAREVVIKGAGKPTQGPVQLAFPKAIIAATYGVPQFSFLNNPDHSLDPAAPYIYATQEVHFSQELIGIENSALELANGHKLNSTFQFSYVNAIANLTIQLHKVPYLPWAAIWEAMQEPLNDATFLGVDAGYLRFMGADTHEEASTDGSFVQDLTLNFAARSNLAWDEMFDPDGTSGPQQVLYNGDSILGQSDLSQLIPTAYDG